MENPIARIRKELGQRVGQEEITPGKLADLAGISMNTIYNLENGRIKTLNQQLLDTLAELGYDPKQVEQDYHTWCEERRRKELERFKRGGDQP